ncbi:MAG: hypothetical protein JSW33_01760, partial [bacterium]
MQNFYQLQHLKRIAAVFFFLSIAFLIFTSFMPGKAYQKSNQTTLFVPLRMEKPDDSYVPVPRETRAISPAYRYSSADFMSTQVNVLDTNFNIIGDAANEPSIAVDPTDP